MRLTPSVALAAALALACPAAAQTPDSARLAREPLFTRRDAAATGEIGRWRPGYRLPAGIALYTGAALVGVSRMYENRRWASDVVVGAAIGTFSGWKVVSYTRANPRKPVDRILLRTSVVPTGRGGVLLAWTAAP
jgi:membrane-associated phospholipid phosphatase